MYPSNSCTTHNPTASKRPLPPPPARAVHSTAQWRRQQGSALPRAKNAIQNRTIPVKRGMFSQECSTIPSLLGCQLFGATTDQAVAISNCSRPRLQWETGERAGGPTREAAKPHCSPKHETAEGEDTDLSPPRGESDRQVLPLVGGDATNAPLRSVVATSPVEASPKVTSRAEATGAGGFIAARNDRGQAARQTKHAVRVVVQCVKKYTQLNMSGRGGGACGYATTHGAPPFFFVYLFIFLFTQSVCIVLLCFGGARDAEKLHSVPTRNTRLGCYLVCVRIRSQGFERRYIT